MAKYSEEFKVQVVQEYLNGPLDYKFLTKKYAISSHSTLICWVKAYKELGLERLNKKHKKATCADNSIMENFFGILKQEMYHGEKLVHCEELKLRIVEYIEWYNNVRSKVKLADLSPVEYRTHTSQSAV